MDPLEAIEGDPAIAIIDPTIYSNTSNPQTIYVRVTIPVTANAHEGCFEIVELVLIVNPLPDATAVIEDYTICEVGSNGTAIFDLTTKIPEVLNGQDPSVFEVSFYETPLDASGATNAIVNTTTYLNDGSPSPPGQALYVGILNTLTGCYIAS